MEAATATPSTTDLRRFSLIRSINEEERSATFVISDPSPDRHRTVIAKNAWILDHYQNNPIVAYMHETERGILDAPNPDLIIGTSEVWWDGDRLMGKVFFEPATDNAFAEKIWKKVKNKTLRMASVGFIPLEDPVRGKRELSQDPNIYYWTQDRTIELIEWSIVHIGSNRNALSRGLDNYIGHLEEVPAQEEHTPHIPTETEIKAARIRARRQLFMNTQS